MSPTRLPPSHPGGAEAIRNTCTYLHGQLAVLIHLNEHQIEQEICEFLLTEYTPRYPKMQSPKMN